MVQLQRRTSTCSSYHPYDSCFTFRLRVPKPCLYMLGSPSRTVVFACVPRPCLYMLGSSTPVVCERRVYHTRSSRGASKRRTFLTVHTKEEHIIILILTVRDHLIMLPSRSKQNKMHKRINITCIKGLTSHAWIMWYDMVLLALGSPSCASWHDLHHSTGAAPRSMAPPCWLSSKITTYHMDMIFGTQAINLKTTIRLLPVCHNLQIVSSHTSNL